MGPPGGGGRGVEGGGVLVKTLRRRSVYLLWMSDVECRYRRGGAVGVV